MKLICALAAVVIAWRRAKNGNPAYVAFTKRGVPFVAVFLAFDREAWQVSQRAIQEFRGSVVEVSQEP